MAEPLLQSRTCQSASSPPPETESKLLHLVWQFLAANIFSADHLAINETGKRQQDGSQIAAGTQLFVVQGQDPSDPAARRSVTDVAQAVERPVEQSLQKVYMLTQQQVQVLAQQNEQTQDESVRAQRMG